MNPEDSFPPVDPDDITSQLGRSTRRSFLQAAGLGTAALGFNGAALAQGNQKIPGFDEVGTDPDPSKGWEPVSDRKIRVGIVGYGVCRFGAAFSFQDHPNVEVVAVSDLFPDRCAELAKECRCEKTYPSLEELVKDDSIEAVFVATDAPSHPRHCMEVLNHGKHVATAVPAVYGSLEDADKLLETVIRTGLKYMMFETSSFREDCYAMRQIYQAGGFGRLIYSEGEYYHFHTHNIGSYKNWRVGSVPLWYPTHSTAYYVGVTDKPFVSVSCTGSNSGIPDYQPDKNQYGNTFTDQIALFETAEGGASRMLMCKGTNSKGGETGRVFGEKGWMEGIEYRGTMENLPKIARPPLPPNVKPGGHGGSHGQLMNEFVLSILEDRKPQVDIIAALNMTVGGIIANESALKGGERLKVPQYTL
ncbi:MAG: Gfo/Idh/MocA family oxidoreductase [Candidatus Omnitrophica bacterium]|nr:Gfo/Idh/MocA family oxidoreductase [Candidatus Omnitrophota bacterium]